MQNKQLFIIVSIVLCVCPSLKGQTIEWAINPQYDSLEYIDEEHLMFSINGKCGIISTSGSVNVQAEYDKLILHKDGSILAVTFETADRTRLNALIDRKTFLKTPPDSTYYLTPYSYFSEDKMCVRDTKGKMGFIDRAGNNVIRCKYDRALPFANGRSAVKIGKDNGYITSTGARFRMNGTFTDTFSFHEGEAVVFRLNGHVSKSRDGKVINTDGSVVRDWDKSEDETRKLAEATVDYSVNGPTESYVYQFIDRRSESTSFTIVSENGEYGFLKDNEPWISPQFVQVSPFKDDLAFVKKGGKWGLLRKCSGSFGVALEKTAVVLKKENSYLASFLLNIPEEWRDKDLSVQMATGTSLDYCSMNIIEKNGNTWRCEYPIDLKDKPSSVDFRWKILGEGLLLADQFTNHLSITYQKPEADISVSLPQLVEGKADENDRQTVFVNITNRGEEDVLLHVSFHVDGYDLSPASYDINLQPGQTRRIESKASKILEDATKHVKVVVSGENINKTVSSHLLFKIHYQL